MINVEAYAAAKAWAKRNMGAQAQLVATVTNGSSMPTQRATGAALMAGDFVMPKTSSTFPFTTADSKATFNNKQDVAVWSGIEWLMNAHTFQRSNEVTLANKATESISGTANYQSDVNIENKAKFDTKLDKSTATVSLEHAYIHKSDGSDGLMQINTNANAGLAIVRRDLDKQINVPLAPLGDDDATSKKYVDDALANKVDKSTEATVLYGTDASGNQIRKGYTVAKSSNSIMMRDNAGRTQVGTPTIPDHAANKQYVDDSKAQVDNVTLDINALQQFQIRDSGVKNAKIEDDAVTIGKIADANISTAIPSAGAVDTKLATEKAVKDALDLKQDTLIAGDNITIDADGKTISSNQIDDSLATSTEKTYSIDKIKEEIRIAGATFRGAFNTKADLDDYSGTKEKNDRAIVTKDETHSDSTTLYSWNGTAWIFEYVVSTKPLELDEITIDYNASGKLEVKNEGISLEKFAKHAGDEGKAYTIKSDGTTWLEKIANYKRVSTFASVSGDTYTAYYLDTPCIVGSVTYEKGVYVWSTANGFELVANTGSGGGTTPILVGVVSPGDMFPIVRPDGSVLVMGDYVKPYPGATFPFIIGTVTFTNARDTAVYMGSGNWLLNASVYQKTNETPVNSNATESINGATSAAVYQADINAENKTAINAAVNNGLFFKTSDGKINLNLKDRSGNDVVNENIEEVVFMDDGQILKNKDIDADNNTITNLTGSNLKSYSAAYKGQTWVLQTDGSWALGKAGSDVDDVTIILNDEEKVSLKDADDYTRKKVLVEGATSLDELFTKAGLTADNSGCFAYAHNCDEGVLPGTFTEGYLKLQNCNANYKRIEYTKYYPNETWTALKNDGTWSEWTQFGKTVEIVNDLIHFDSDKALSALQGRNLNDYKLSNIRYVTNPADMDALYNTLNIKMLGQFALCYIEDATKKVLPSWSNGYGYCLVGQKCDTPSKYRAITYVDEVSGFMFTRVCINDVWQEWQQINAEIVDSLSSAASDKALSAHQGKVLDETKLNKTIFVENATTLDDLFVKANINSNNSSCFAYTYSIASGVFPLGFTEGYVRLSYRNSSFSLIEFWQYNDATAWTITKESGTWKTWKKVGGEIVDSLTSTDANKALSANMGKTLQDTKQSKVYFQSTEPSSAVEGDLWADGGSQNYCPYPINATLVQYTASDNPNTLYPGTTWTDITSTMNGRYLQFSSSDSVATTKAEQLPNIRGTFGRWLNNVVWSGYTSGAFAGPVQLSSLEQKPDASVGSNSYTYGMTFSASDSNNKYVDGGKVQPLTYTVKLWKRTA